MTVRPLILQKLWKRNLATILLFLAATAGAFATLGEGEGKKKNSLLSDRYLKITPGKFTLKSGYRYRGSQVVSQTSQNSTISLNSIITYQKGHTTYIVPLKTRFANDKIKISVGIPGVNN